MTAQYIAIVFASATVACILGHVAIYRAIRNFDRE
jgi:hypothetical protein